MDAGAADYLARIGLNRPPASDPAGLAALVRAHRLSIPFENLDIRLGRGIALEPDAIFAKLVGARRGGYCFEQNLLLHRMLAAFGVMVEPLLARVWMRAAGGEVPPRTHLLLKAQIAGETWLADAGFGGGYCPPLVLADGASVTGPDGALHRLRRLGEPGSERGEWLLERSADRGATWHAQYGFDNFVAPFADIEAANHWTATRPGIRFTTLHLASRVLPEGIAALTDRVLSVTGQEDRTLADADSWHAALNEVFAIPLSRAEVAALPLFAAG